MNGQDREIDDPEEGTMPPEELAWYQRGIDTIMSAGDLADEGDAERALAKAREGINRLKIAAFAVKYEKARRAR